MRCSEGESTPHPGATLDSGSSMASLRYSRREIGSCRLWRGECLRSGHRWLWQHPRGPLGWRVPSPRWHGISDVSAWACPSGPRSLSLLVRPAAGRSRRACSVAEQTGTRHSTWAVGTSPWKVTRDPQGEGSWVLRDPTRQAWRSPSPVPQTGPGPGGRPEGGQRSPVRSGSRVAAPSGRAGAACRPSELTLHGHGSRRARKWVREPLHTW